MERNKDDTILELSLNGNTAQIRMNASPTAATFLIAHAIIRLSEAFNISVDAFRDTINGAIDHMIELMQEKEEEQEPQEKEEQEQQEEPFINFEGIVKNIFGLK